MSKVLQLKRGTKNANDSYTGAIAELTYDTESKELRVHDGVTQGGKVVGAGLTSVSWNDVTDKPTIPSATSQLTNDSNFITTSEATTIASNSASNAVTNHNGNSNAHSNIITPIKNVIPTAATSSNQLADKKWVQSTLESFAGIIYKVKGSVATYNDLPQNAQPGDVYNVIDTGANYVYVDYADIDSSKSTDIGETVANVSNQYALLSKLNEWGTTQNADITHLTLQKVSAEATTYTVKYYWMASDQEGAEPTEHSQTLNSISTNVLGNWGITITTFDATTVLAITHNKLGWDKLSETVTTNWDDITNKPTTFTPSAHTHTVSEISDFPTLSNVATSGDYDDLTNKPTIPAAQVQTDWNATEGMGAILNKPTIPTKTSDLTNDSGYITSNALTGYATENYVDTGLSAKQDTISDLSTIRSGAALGVTAVQPSDLSTVATSGSYNDLSNKPTIPTVNNGTLDIQVNGTSIGTFTANQDNNTTANIVVPDSATWGNITGTLSNQTDLQDALDAKQDILTSDNAGSGISIETVDGVVKINNTKNSAEWGQIGGDINQQTDLKTALDNKQNKLTQVQLDAVNSGITNGLVAKISTNETTINDHIANTSNPHSVTKEQIGLSNVDNTSDLSKPISTATQTALNGKQETLVSGTNIKTVNGSSLLGSGNITIGDAVDSVNGQTGAVVLTASDVGALPDSTVIPTVNNSTISFTQGGVSKGSFTLNQASGATIELDAGGSDVEAFTAAEVQTIWDNN